MRKFVLIAAMLLVSATAQAGETRSLSLTSTDPSVTSTPPKAAETTRVQTVQTTDAATPPAASTETPKFVERPAVVDTTTTPAQPKVDNKADGSKPVRQTANKADKRRHRQHWTEARIIGELHRHGIYW
jgi:hypothetical protein